MAQGENKEINQLEQATDIQDADLFVLEQGGEAKKLEGETLKGYAEDAGAESGAAAGEIAGRQAAYEMYTGKKKYNYPDTNVLDIVVTDAVNTRLKSTVIKGKTVAVNQFSNANNGGGNNISSVTDYGNGRTGTATFTAGSFYSPVHFNSNHVYYAAATVSATTSATFYIQMRPQNQSAIGESTRINISANGKATCELIATNENLPGTGYIYTFFTNATANTTQLYLTNVMLIDLTLIFTSAELTAIGTDVSKLKAAWLKKFGYPLPLYIPYNAGSLVNTDGEYRLRGRNLWDEEWELGSYSSGDGSPVTDSTSIRSKSTNYIRVTGGETYYAKCPANISIKYYDANYNFVGYYLVSGGNGTFTVPTNAVFVRFNVGGAYGNTYHNDICINISDASINGHYFPYYNGGTIDCSTAPLNGVGTAQDEKDYATGMRTTRMQIDDMGDLTWYKNNSWGFYGVLSKTPKNFVYGATGNAICSKYPAGNGDAAPSGGTFCIYGGYIRVGDTSYADGDAFKTAMTGQKVCYELATPVTTTETPQPVYTQYGYNVFEPVSGGVQSAEVAIEYAVPNATQDDIWNLLPHKVVDNNPDNAVFAVPMLYSAPAPIRKSVIKGRTVAQNQLVQNGNFADGTTGWRAAEATISVSGGVATLTPTSATASIIQDQAILAHTYYLKAKVKLTNSTNASRVRLSIRFGSTAVDVAICSETTSWQIIEGIGSGTANNVGYIRLIDLRGTGNGTVDVTEFMLKDLTAEGYTSAETTDVATFKAAFLRKNGYPLPMYMPYDAGSLSNVNGVYRMRGRNLWDEEWEVGKIDSNGQNVAGDAVRSKNYIPVNPNSVLYFCTSNTEVFIWAYDANKTYVGRIPTSSSVANMTVLIPDNVAYIRFRCIDSYGTTYHNDICINISDASINGHYFPYYNGGTIDCSTAPLNGVGTAQDEKDFASGKRTTRGGMVDLGTLSWTKQGSGDSIVFYSEQFSEIKGAGAASTFNGVCGKYTTVSLNSVEATDKSIAVSTTPRIYIHDSAYSSGDATAFQTAMNGVYLCYELATPVVSYEPPYPLESQLGYNCLEPVSGGVQSGNVSVKYVETVEGYINELVGA